MKATTSVKMAVLAGAVCAMVALPAFAHADTVQADDPGKLSPAVVQALMQLGASQTPDPGHLHMALDRDAVTTIDPDVVQAIIAAGADVDGDDAALGDPPVAAGAAVPTPAPAGPSIMVPSHVTTPSITSTPTVPHRHNLPYTGGNSLGWILAGVAVVALGVALAAWGFGTGARKADLR
jgi:hypothetical protein